MNNIKRRDPNRNDMIGVHLVAELQRRHVFFCNILPLAGAAAAVAIALYRPPGLGEFVALFTMWGLIGIGVSVGYHRYFTHQSFQACTFVRLALAVWGSMSAQGPLAIWVATHRRHHQFSDREGDPHSPNLESGGWLRGLFHAHYGWITSHPVPNPSKYAKDIMGDRRLMWVNNHYYLIVLAGVLVPGLLLGAAELSFFGLVTGCLWGGAVRIVLGSQFIWCVNSLCHTIGSRPYNTREHSTNNAFLAIPTCGESWHNNHHAFPWSACLGHRPWQIDPGYVFIAALRAIGLVWDVRTPGAERMAAKKFHPAEACAGEATSEGTSGDGPGFRSSEHANVRTVPLPAATVIETPIISHAASRVIALRIAGGVDPVCDDLHEPVTAAESLSEIRAAIGAPKSENLLPVRLLAEPDSVSPVHSTIAP